MRRRELLAGGAALALGAPSVRAASTFPERPVTLICPSLAGGGADAHMRVLAAATTKHLGQPIEQARQQLSFKYLHMKAGLTGVLDYMFEVYLRDIEPKGISFLEWVDSPQYDPAAIKADFKAETNIDLSLHAPGNVNMFRKSIPGTEYLPIPLG